MGLFGLNILGGIAKAGVDAKAAAEKRKLSKELIAAGNRSMPFVTEAGGELKKWGEEDWARFKESYRPVADALVDDANQAPDYNRYEKEATLSAARGIGDANAAIRGDVSRSGAGPSSGRFAAASMKAAGARGATEGLGQVMGRQAADQLATNKKLGAIDMGRPDPSSSVAGLGLVIRGGQDYGKYGTAIGRQANESMGDAAKGIGKMIGRNYRTDTGPKLTNPSDGWGDVGSDDNGGYNGGDGGTYGGGGDYGDAPSFADGGVIRGPGTGRSDSIPAVIDGRLPARVSNGEYRISADVVSVIGKRRLDSLISISRG